MRVGQSQQQYQWESNVKAAQNIRIAKNIVPNSCKVGIREDGSSNKILACVVFIFKYKTYKYHRFLQ